MLVERGLNAAWVAPRAVVETAPDARRITLREALGQEWDGDVVGWDVPAAPGLAPVAVTLAGVPVPFQTDAGRLYVRVDRLAAGEERVYDVALGAAKAAELPAVGEVFGNDTIEVRLPAPGEYDAAELPGPIRGIREVGGDWVGAARLDDAPGAAAVEVRAVAAGPLWTTVAVTYDFAGGYGYCVHLTLRPGEGVVEVHEASDLPVRLWPAPRPYNEAGSLGKSHWNLPLDELTRPCLRPRQRTNVVFEPGAGWAPDSIVTHSTSSWEIMHLPLTGDGPRSHTVMRPGVPFIDGGWFGVYRQAGDRLLGVASLDLVNWRTPDRIIHPKHRMPGATAEVVMLSGDGQPPRWLFPVENVERRWLLAFLPYTPPARAADAPHRGDPDPTHPLWALRRRRGDLRLDKVKDWVVDWPDAGHDHPRLLCRREDFAAIRRQVEAVPELRANRDATIADHAADRWLLRGEAAGLAAVEAAIHARELIEGILAKGYAGPTYAIGLGRPMRRYVMACDIMWDSFTPAERQEVRRVCALAAYIMTDGDWWQYAWKRDETTYLPNFDTDVFTAAGMVGLFLSDHPCHQVWNGYLAKRMDLELDHHLRLDGGGEENLGNYLPATWKQLYMPTLWALRQTGVRDFSADARIHAGARFLLRVLGPPDPRDHGWRMLPPIGHHPYARKALTFGPWLAAFVRDADPELAANLQWGWRATGAIVDRNQDHSGELANPLTRHYILHDPTIPEIEPDLGSHDLPNVGAVVRNHDATGQGGFLLLKAGRVHSHHDDDEGSFHWSARGVPLAQDGLPLANGATAAQHNAVSFARRGQPTGRVEVFADHAAGAYIRAVMPPDGYINDAMYIPDCHHSGWTRELLLVKAPEPGAIEYLVVKDTCAGPDACQWNLDVLSTRPEVTGNHAHFPGHAVFDLGLDVYWFSPEAPQVSVEEGRVSPDVVDPVKRAALSVRYLAWDVHEHWLLHLGAGAGSTFLTVLFPRRLSESVPRITHFARESSLVIEHDAGRDLVFLRPTAAIPFGLDGAWFQGRAGLVRERDGEREYCPFDARILAPGVGPEPETL